MEAQEITKKADDGLQALQQQDASLSDMLAFSKAISTGKTAQEVADEEEKKQKQEEAAQKEAEEKKQNAEAEEKTISLNPPIKHTGRGMALPTAMSVSDVLLPMVS